MAVNVGPGYYNQDGHIGTIRTGQVSVAQSPVEIVSSSDSRVGLVVTNTGAATVFVGTANCDLPNDGHALPSGSSLGLDTSTALYGQAATGTNLVTFLEERIV